MRTILILVALTSCAYAQQAPQQAPQQQPTTPLENALSQKLLVELNATVQCYAGMTTMQSQLNDATQKLAAANEKINSLVATHNPAPPKENPKQ